MIIGEKSQKIARYYRRVLWWLSAKKVENLPDIIGTYWEKHWTGGWVCGWGGGLEYLWHHDRLSAKKVDKLLDIIGAYWDKKTTRGGRGGEYLWHLLASKSQLIIVQKSRKIVQYIGGGISGLEHLWHWLSSKKV